MVKLAWCCAHLNATSCTIQNYTGDIVQKFRFSAQTKEDVSAAQANAC
jgi:hypothetical protein